MGTGIHMEKCLKMCSITIESIKAVANYLVSGKILEMIKYFPFSVEAIMKGENIGGLGEIWNIIPLAKFKILALALDLKLNKNRITVTTRYQIEV